MFDKKELCQKIIELYPDLGACEIDVDAFYSTAKGTWVVEHKITFTIFAKHPDSGWQISDVREVSLTYF
ncbi:MAG: hypothetical protein P8Y08_05670 [Desulfobulbaceae bacterium]